MGQPNRRHCSSSVISSKSVRSCPANVQRICRLAVAVPPVSQQQAASPTAAQSTFLGRTQQNCACVPDSLFHLSLPSNPLQLPFLPSYTSPCRFRFPVICCSRPTINPLFAQPHRAGYFLKSRPKSLRDYFVLFNSSFPSFIE